MCVDDQIEANVLIVEYKWIKCLRSIDCSVQLRDLVKYDNQMKLNRREKKIEEDHLSARLTSVVSTGVFSADSEDTEEEEDATAARLQEDVDRLQLEALSRYNQVQSLTGRLTSAQQNEATRECSICIQRISLEDRWLVTKCFHFFHVRCLGTHLLRNSACPNCRQPLNTTKHSDDVKMVQGKATTQNQQQQPSSSSSSSSSSDTPADSFVGYAQEPVLGQGEYGTKAERIVQMVLHLLNVHGPDTKILIYSNYRRMLGLLR